MSWSAFMRIKNGFLVDETTTKIPVPLRKCTKKDKMSYFPDIGPDLDNHFLDLLCIDDPTKVEFFGSSLKGRN